jgi:hypothetical protein
MNEQNKNGVVTHSNSGPTAGVIDTRFGIPPFEWVRAFIARDLLRAIGHAVRSVVR